MSEAYGAFAYAYDRALGDRFFVAVRRVVDDALRRYPTPKRTHLDLACGTGAAVRHFIKKGWKSLGVDASYDMLRVAQSRGGRFVTADIRRLPLRRTFARITCLYDSLNHMLDREELVNAFRAVRGVMADDSLFLFDVNHPEIYPEVWGLSEPFISSGRDYHLEIATTYRSREKLGRANVTGWANLNGERVEIQEMHLQRAYSQREITKSLNEADLEVVEVLDFDPYGESETVEAPTVKLFFVVRPKSGTAGS